MRRALLLGLCLLSCSRSGQPPYGFSDAREQRWRFEAEDSFEIDGAPARSVRFADLILRPKLAANGETELELLIDRYYARTEGTPDGGSEFAISEKGISIKTPKAGSVGFGPSEKTLGGDTPLEMRARPIASIELDANGDVIRPYWQSPHPMLMDVAILDWLVTALPTRKPEGDLAWVARRTVPQTGRFNLGVDLPLRWEVDPKSPLSRRASGSVARESIRVTEGLEGRLQIDAIGEATLLPDGHVRKATFELRLDLESPDDTHVRSRHQLRVSCTSCEDAVNPPAPDSDSANDREGNSQQRHVDDLPDHGGVRRGL